MFLKIVGHELKQITRDRMYASFLIFEIILISTASLLLPYLEKNVSDVSKDIALIMLLLITGIIFGAISGFSMLDDKDDGVLLSLKITPIRLNVYVLFKLIVSFTFSFIGTISLFVITGLSQNMTIPVVLMITILSSLQAPFIALIMATFASNKVEGFVIMKLTGLTLIGPIMALFISDWTELLLGIFPGFWPSRMMIMEVTSLSYTFSNTSTYFLIGSIFNVLVLTLLFRIYRKKHHI